MKRKSKAGRARQPPPAIGGGATSLGVDVPIEGSPDSLVRSGPEGVEQVASVAAQDPAQTDIERADERKVGSIETVPQPDPSSGAIGFIEAPGPEPTDSP